MSTVSYLLVDQIAFEKLVTQPENSAGERDVTISGYEAYIIEQWACERRPNVAVASFTGNHNNSVQVSVLVVPENTEDWGPVTLAHFEELMRMHMLPKETPMGRMLVTNISSLPSHLTLVSLHEDFSNGLHWFCVNENLRRLSCTGRTAVTAIPPSDSVVGNFRQMFRISYAVPVEFAVNELVTLLQISLYYFGLLEPAYVDGLLCDHTVKALEEWWNTIGKPRYGRKPVSNEKLYLTISVAAVIGTVTGARQRLSALKYKPPKDPFDAEQFVISIKRFQKSEHLPKTMRLDDTTFRRLVQLTAKLNGDGGNDILKVMKSTMIEGLSGKTTAVINDWETTSLEILASNARGDRCRYLWQGRGEQRSVPGSVTQGGSVACGAVTGIPLSSLSEGSDEVTAPRHQSIVNRFRKSGRGLTGSGPVLDRPNEESSHTSVAHPYGTHKPYDYGGHSRNNSDWFMSPSPGKAAKTPPATQSQVVDQELIASPEIDKKRNHLSEKMKRMLLTHDDCILYLHKRSSVGTLDPSTTVTSDFKLRRSHSMSEIEKIVFPLNSLCSRPKVIQLYEEARRLQTQLNKKMTVEAAHCQVLDKQIVAREARLDAEQRSHALIRFQVHASIRKEQTVKRRLRELEAFMSRIEYEYDSLETKLNDVEASVESFSSKVEALEQRYINGARAERAWLPTILGF